MRHNSLIVMTTKGNKMKQIKEMALKAITDHPELKSAIEDSWEMMIDEIEEGSSRENEIESFHSWLSYELTVVNLMKGES